MLRAFVVERGEGVIEVLGRDKMMAEDRNSRNKAIDMALTQIEKQFGKGSIMRLGDRSDTTGVQAISTGSISLDVALGVGGFPKGRVVEIFGPESSGKTTLALHAVAQAQKTGRSGGLHRCRACPRSQLGQEARRRPRELLVSASRDSGEEALEIAEMLVKSNAVDIIVIDSVAALVPKAELEGEIGDTHVGLAGPADEPGPAQPHRQRLSKPRLS